MVEFALRVIDIRFGLKVERVLVDRLVGVAAELSERGRSLRLGDGNLL
ncbi:hypothetical protein [Sinorhizobium garamanticum]